MYIWEQDTNIPVACGYKERWVMEASFFCSDLVVKVGGEVCVDHNRGKNNTDNGSAVTVLKLRISNTGDTLLENKIWRPRI